MQTYELTILMPCLNEAETLEKCIQKAKNFLNEHRILGEILIADNGSTDGSQAIAKAQGATIIAVEKRGYGAALKKGMHAARGNYVIMGDADDSYDFENLLPFLSKLREGYDLVMGNRFKGGIMQGAMPLLNRYLGNPILSFLGRIFFKSKIGDFHCGLRGFNRDRLRSLHLQGNGMEFASEMVVKATLKNFKITEVPTRLFPDGRQRRSHLRPWRDGWRHLRLLLLFTPRWLFLYPGLFLMLVGFSFMLSLINGPIVIGKINFDIHSLLLSGVLMIVGSQAVCFAIFAKYIAGYHMQIREKNDRFLNAFKYFTLERGLLIGFLLVLSGVIGTASTISYWLYHAFGPLAPTHIMRILIPSSTSLILGIQLIFASFFMSMLEMHYAHQ